MKVTVGDVTNNKVDVRDYLNYDEETDRIYVDGLKLDTVLIDKSKEWESLVERNRRYHELLTSKVLKDLIRLEYKGNFLPNKNWDDFLNFKYSVEALESES